MRWHIHLRLACWQQLFKPFINIERPPDSKCDRHGLLPRLRLNPFNSPLTMFIRFSIGVMSGDPAARSAAHSLCCPGGPQSTRRCERTLHPECRALISAFAAPDSRITPSELQPAATRADLITFAAYLSLSQRGPGPVSVNASSPEPLCSGVKRFLSAQKAFGPSESRRDVCWETPVNRQSVQPGNDIR
jgi:hypothetical protein